MGGPRPESPSKTLPHPLRGMIQNVSELAFVSSLGNLDSQADLAASRPTAAGRKPDAEVTAPRPQAGGSAAAKKLAAGMRDEHGERISQEQQQAVVPGRRPKSRRDEVFWFLQRWAAGAALVST